MRRLLPRHRLPASLGLALLLALVAVVPAAAAPAWRLDVLSNTTAAPGGTHTFVVQITNVGDATMSLATDPVTLSAAFPGGLSALGEPLVGAGEPRWDCPGFAAGASSLSCQLAVGTIAPSEFRTFSLEAAVDAGAAGVLTSSFEIAGGAPEIASATRVDPTRISATPPGFGVDAFDGEVVDGDGEPYTQAGGHPDAASVSIDFNTVTNPAPLKGLLWPVEPVKNVLADLPPGLVGDPTGAERCTAAQLANTPSGILARALCPPDSQVGTALVRLNGLGLRTVFGPLPVFNMVPPPDVPARFGFNVAGSVVTLDGELRSASDYGLSVRVRNIPQGLAIAGTTLTFWGVPADPVHTPERACAGETAPWEGGPTCATGAARKAFLRVPTACTSPGVGLPVSVRLDSWVRPGAFEEASFVSHLPPGYPFAPAQWGPQQGPTGCEAVPFDPSLAVVPGSGAAGAPSGFAFEVSLPQTDEPAPIGQSDLRQAVVRLPLGVRVNPSAADGLRGCSPAEIGLDRLDEPSCPDGSRLGSLTIETPLLDSALTGSVYLAGPHDNPFDSLLAVYLVARGPGLIVKLAGRVEADPLSGQLTVVFDELPQVPFSHVRIAFDGGPRAPLVNPPVCGRYVVESELTGWSGAVALASSPFALASDALGAVCPAVGVVGGGGARPFAPGFTAGVERPLAGASSPFHLRVTRGDADAELGGLSMRLPRGLLARLSDVVLCGEGDAAAGTCPSDSQVGRVVVGAGAGPTPFYLGGGRVYMTGPYRGAPFGLSIAVPAVAGPFDLGLVVVRAAVFVNRRTAAVSVYADPFPTILQGIPLQLRDVRVAVDRPGFMLNPTGCGPKGVRGVLRAMSGAVVGATSPFQVAECARLPFHPRLRLFVGARGRTRRGVTTPLTAVLTQRPGEAGIRRVSVVLPTVLNARLEVVEDACTPDDFNANSADPSAGLCRLAQIGTAVAVTPLLRDPLRGNVYLVRRPGRPTGLPNIVVALRGQVDFDLTGRVSIPHGKLLRATFPAVPDVPITRFTLYLQSGKRGVIGATANLCTRPARDARTTLATVGQSGADWKRDERLVIRECR